MKFMASPPYKLVSYFSRNKLKETMNVFDMRNCVSVKLVNNRKKERKLAAKLNFEHFTIFDDNLVEIQMKMTPLVFDKPVYCGMSILNISKTQEARVALGYASSNSYASFVLSKLPACFISRWTHADVWTNC